MSDRAQLFANECTKTAGLFWRSYLQNRSIPQQYRMAEEFNSWSIIQRTTPQYDNLASERLMAEDVWALKQVTRMLVTLKPMATDQNYQAFIRRFADWAFKPCEQIPILETTQPHEQPKEIA